MGNYESIQYNYAKIHSTDENTKEIIYRNPDAPEDLYHAQDFQINSIYSLFMYLHILLILFRKARDNYKQNRCLGTKCEYFDDQAQQSSFQYNWKSFDQVFNETQHLAHIIDKNQLYSEVYDQDFDLKLKVVGITSVNREEWLITDLAANLLGVTTVPLYETLGYQMLELILIQTEMSTLFGNNKSLLNILKHSDSQSDQKEDYLQHLKTVICFDECSQELSDYTSSRSIQVLNYHSLLHQRKQDCFNRAGSVDAYEEIDHRQTQRNDIFTISYTSGTEKNSKGVMISNENFLSAVQNILSVAQEFPFTSEDTYISYLPLAHVFDRLGCYSALSVGAGIGFFGGNILKIIDDLQLLKPTIFPSVPRLLNKVYDKIQQGLNQQTMAKRWLFQKGLNDKLFYLQQQGTVQYEVYDRLLFNKIKDRLGGNVRIMITASAPISDNILQFLKCAFCCPIIEAYGQTESCGASFSTKIFDNQAGHVGGPALGIEFKLNDVEEMGYTKNSQPYPQGEICLKGPSLFLGYFKNLELTQEMKDEEGWLHTGDVGMILPGNALKIIDRIKNIFKLSQGEYIVTEKLERVYEQSPFIAQIFIYGDSLQSNIVAIIVPEITTIKNYIINTLGKQGEYENLSDVVQLKEVNELIEKDMMRLAVENGLNGLEKVKHHFRLVDQEFEIGVVLTPTMKIRRQEARNVYQHLIDEIYQQNDHEVNV